MSLTHMSNLSYTNKDFNSIYVELLEYAKKLSYKWDPTASDESDPGLVLLKLAAIIGDKDNYNIDKNILELMPASVTQLPAARQLFDQCGYTMRYYRSATGYVNVLIKNDLGDTEEEKEYIYTVPQFTMFTDSDSTVVYTTTEPATISVKTDTLIPVIEGTVTQYTINGDSLITMQNIDANNRLYFTETNIAENGVFITNISTTESSDYSYWERVDNLQVQPKGKPCYKFGITLDNSLCYIEFPDDIESLISEGLNITYILTSGGNGNIAAGKLKQFYVDTKFIRKMLPDYTETQVDATTENITIRNILPISNGQDPQSIDEAYKDYKRVQDTFKTLVSLKDYSDYLITSKSASNGYVCDRTNDIQRTYKVITTDGQLNTVVQQKTKTYCDVITDESGNYIISDPVSETTPIMDAFNLCVYALEYVPTITSDAAFKSSFKIVRNDGSFTKTDDVKSLQHDFLEFEPEKILMLKNKYPITANIVPRYKLSETEKFQVLYNIERALQDTLNSNCMTFGQPPSVEDVQTIILNADERIKTLIDFDSFTYETYAVYAVDESKQNIYGEFHELRIDNDSFDGGYLATNVTRNKFNDLKQHLYYKDSKGNIVPVDSHNDLYDSSKTYFVFDEYLSKLWSRFRVEIFAKNVLAGVTSLYKDNNIYKTSVSQDDVHEYEGVVKITTNTDIKLTQQKQDEKILKSPVLRENESILLQAPNFVEENNFSSYVKVLYDFPSCKDTEIQSDSKYELQGDDFIIFFWQSSDVSTTYEYIKYDSSSESLAKYISPSGLNLKKNQVLTSTKHSNVNESNVIDYFKKSLSAGKGTTKNIQPATPFVQGQSYTDTEFVKNCLTSESNNQVLTGTRIIKTLYINKILINNTINGCKDVYWMLNNDTNTLFNRSDVSYTLKSGEYFIYTNDEKTALYLLGEGTLLERSFDWTTSTLDIWQVPKISYSELLVEGVDILADKWFTLKKTSNENSYGLWATEQQQILIGSGSFIELEKSDLDITELYLSNTPTPLKGYTIRYTDAASNTNNVTSITSDDLSWSATSILNVDVSAETPQKLEEGQSLELYNENDELVHSSPLAGRLGADGEYIPLYVLCNTELNLIGGNLLDVGYIHTSGAISFMTYEMKSDSLSVTHNIDNTVLHLNTNDADFQLNFKLIPGKYLLTIRPSADIKQIELSGNGILRVSDTNFYRVEIPGSDAQEIDLKLHVEGKINSTITIPPLFRYSNENLTKIDMQQGSQITFEDAILSCISSLDVFKEFDYTYRPVNEIENPLISTSFLKKRHFYNLFTICEWSAVIDNYVSIFDIIR